MERRAAQQAAEMEQLRDVFRANLPPTPQQLQRLLSPTHTITGSESAAVAAVAGAASPSRSPLHRQQQQDESHIAAAGWALQLHELEEQLRAVRAERDAAEHKGMYAFPSLIQ